MNAFSFNAGKEKLLFSNWNYNKGIYFDEKKKRFVDFNDMDNVSYKNYADNFTSVNKHSNV